MNPCICVMFGHKVLMRFCALGVASSNSAHVSNCSARNDEEVHGQKRQKMCVLSFTFWVLFFKVVGS